MIVMEDHLHNFFYFVLSRPNLLPKLASCQTIKDCLFELLAVFVIGSEAFFISLLRFIACSILLNTSLNATLNLKQIIDCWVKIKENLNQGLSLSLSLNINLKSNFAAGGSFLRRIWRITNGPRSASVNGNPSPHKLPTTPQTFFSVRPTHNVPQN